MATPNPQEIQRLLDKLEAAYRRLGETNPFQNFDVNQFRDATTAVRALEDGLRGVEDRLDGVRENLDYIQKSFTDSLNELSRQNVYLKIQKSSLSDLNSLASKALSIRRGESDISDKVLKKLKEQTRENLNNLKLVKEKGGLEGEALDKLNEQIAAAQDLEDKLQDIENTHKEINKELGFMPKIAGGVDKAFSKLGLPDLGFSDALNDTLKAGQAAKGLGQDFNAVGEFTKRAGENLKGMLSKANLIQFAITQLVDALIKTDKNTGELAKNMGVSYDESLKMASSMSDIANLSGETYVTTENLIKAQTSLSKAFGTNVLLSGELLKDYAQITEQAGYSAEAATSLGKITQATGGDLSKNTASILGAATAFNATNKLALNEKEIVEEVAKTGAATVLTFNKSTKALADNVLQAKKFGLNLEQASKIADGLLNFQSSIESELEAELLTGKQLNFEQARLLALQGKTGEAAAEVAKQVGGSAEFGKMNVLAQDALAKSMNMTRDELAQSILDREVLAKLGEKEGSAQDAYNNLKKQGLSDDAIAAKLGDEKLATQLKSQSIQDRFNASIAKMQELFVSVAEPILAIVSPLMDLVMVVLPLINKLLQPIKTTFDGISKIISGDLENLSFWEAALGGIAVVLGGILGLNRAISVIEARVTLAKELQLGLGAQILTGLGLQNMALNYQIAREQGMNVLRAIGAALEQTKLGAIIAQGVGIVKNIGKLIIENAARFAGAIAAITTASAATLGIGIAAIVAGIAAGAMALKSAQKADDMVSEGGYGKRTLLAPEGAIKLNDKDTVIAGTNLGGRGGTQASTSSPSIDLSPLLAKMDQMNTILNQLLAKEGTVTLDGNKVGTALTMGSYKIQ
jgi:hypothetical protein